VTIYFILYQYWEFVFAAKKARFTVSAHIFVLYFRWYSGTVCGSGTGSGSTVANIIIDVLYIAFHLDPVTFAGILPYDQICFLF
jgi:hypothetical protein